MATLDHVHNLDVFWDDEFKRLNYNTEAFNNPQDTELWLSQGYPGQFTGAMCDMRSPQPSWNNKFIEYFSSYGWQDIGTSYYRMNSGTILPVHRDTYKKYVELFGLEGKEHTIRRAIVFLEDWKSGHYLELKGVPVTGWRAGFTVVWAYDAPHMAANIGVESRYTLQITGHV